MLIRLEVIDPPDVIKMLRFHESHMIKPKLIEEWKKVSIEKDTVEIRALVFRASAFKDPDMKHRDPLKESQVVECVRKLVEAEADQQERSRSSPGQPSSLATQGDNGQPSSLATQGDNGQPSSLATQGDNGQPSGLATQGHNIPKWAKLPELCNTCIAREKKRLTRSSPKEEEQKPGEKKRPTRSPKKEEQQNLGEKKRLTQSPKEEQRKPGETDEWLEKTSRRICFFCKPGPSVEWQLPPSRHANSAATLKDAPPAPSPDDDVDDASAVTTTNGKTKGKQRLWPPVEEGTIAADLPMRICCYCRHHDEKEGFRQV